MPHRHLYGSNVFFFRLFPGIILLGLNLLSERKQGLKSNYDGSLSHVSLQIMSLSLFMTVYCKTTVFDPMRSSYHSGRV